MNSPETTINYIGMDDQVNSLLFFELPALQDERTRQFMKRSPISLQKCKLFITRKELPRVKAEAAMKIQSSRSWSPERATRVIDRAAAHLIEHLDWKNRSSRIKGYLYIYGCDLMVKRFVICVEYIIIIVVVVVVVITELIIYRMLILI